jgi:hypothetical protein
MGHWDEAHMPTSTPVDRSDKRRLMRRSNKIWAGSFDGRNPDRREGHGVKYGVRRTGPWD